MIPQQSTWGIVEAGEYVKDGNGKTWKVTHLPVSEITGDRGVTLVDREGHSGTIARPPDDKPVIKLVLGADEVATDLIRTGLGGQVLAVRGTTEQVWHTPELAELDWGRRHMLDMHHVDCSELDLGRLVALHSAAHEGIQLAVPHDHNHALQV